MARSRPAAECAKLFMDFVEGTGSPFHTVAASHRIFRAAGFQELTEGSPWHVVRGGQYFVGRSDGAVFAFVVGRRFNPAAGSGISLLGAHTDSPCLRLRPVSKIPAAGGTLLAGAETYGGGLWSTWLDRGLGLAGRVVFRCASPQGAAVAVAQTDLAPPSPPSSPPSSATEPSAPLTSALSGPCAARLPLRSTLVHLPGPLLVIPSLAIHLLEPEERARPQLSPEKHLRPILCIKQADDEAAALSGGEHLRSSSDPPHSRHHAALLGIVARATGCEPADIVDTDLCLMDAQPPQLLGAYGELICSPRIDNNLSTWAAVLGLSELSSSAAFDELRDICAVASFDHEECGSVSSSGAAAALLPSWLDRLLEALGVASAQRPEIFSRSFLASADGAHGLHPSYEDRHQAEHRPLLGAGLVAKRNANQSYATSVVSTALFREVCQVAGVPVQDFVPRNGAGCGSTIGPLLSAKLGMRCVDFGAPQLAMHSCRELCAAVDARHLLAFCGAFFEHFRWIDESLTTSDR